MAHYLLINITKKAEVFVLRFSVNAIFYNSFLFCNITDYDYAFVSSFFCLGSFFASKTML